MKERKKKYRRNIYIKKNKIKERKKERKKERMKENHKKDEN